MPGQAPPLPAVKMLALSGSGTGTAGAQGFVRCQQAVIRMRHEHTGQRQASAWPIGFAQAIRRAQGTDKQRLAHQFPAVCCLPGCQKQQPACSLLAPSYERTTSHWQVLDPNKQGLRTSAGGSKGCSVLFNLLFDCQGGRQSSSPAQTWWQTACARTLLSPQGWPCS